jgi:hypothetical protein
MTVVTMRGTYESLASALDRFYRDYRFADVFVSLSGRRRGWRSGSSGSPGWPRCRRGWGWW